ncbi:MAG: hypothetical protein JSS82_03595 [Bacteroidetes bacterium]|nr:hypothetical protein [Bacteroidota bacterium]
MSQKPSSSVEEPQLPGYTNVAHNTDELFPVNNHVRNMRVCYSIVAIMAAVAVISVVSVFMVVPFLASIDASGTVQSIQTETQQLHQMLVPCDSGCNSGNFTADSFRTRGSIFAPNGTEMFDLVDTILLQQEKIDQLSDIIDRQNLQIELLTNMLSGSRLS